jgi:hypothetical protein
MAAKRLVRFTEYMHQEYDLEVLERPLRLSDVETKCGTRGKEVMNSLKTGHSQLLPFRDRSGRRVFTTHVKGKSFDAEIGVGYIGSVFFLLGRRTKLHTGSMSPLSQFKVFQYLWLVARQTIYCCLFYAKKSSNAWNRKQDNFSSTFIFERQDERKR